MDTSERGRSGAVTVGNGVRLRAAGVGFLAPLVAAAALAGAAVFTVVSAGCEDPATIVTTEAGPTLVGGCGIPGLAGPDLPGDPADARRG